MARVVFWVSWGIYRLAMRSDTTCAPWLAVASINGSQFRESGVRDAFSIRQHLLRTLVSLDGDRSSCCSFRRPVVGGAICVFALVVARYFSRLAAIVAAFGLFGAAYAFAIGNFMTEALGVPLGLFGLTLLVGLRRWTANTALLYSGLAFFSIGMFARMGALLVLPLLALWACVVVFRSAAEAKVILCFGGARCGCCRADTTSPSGLALGGDPAVQAAITLTTLYGLSTGSRDWSQSYRDFEELSPSSSRPPPLPRSGLQRLRISATTHRCSCVACCKMPKPVCIERVHIRRRSLAYVNKSG